VVADEPWPELRLNIFECADEEGRSADYLFSVYLVGTKDFCFLPHCTKKRHG